MNGFMVEIWISLFICIGTALAIDLTFIERMRQKGKTEKARNLSLGMWSILAIAYGFTIAMAAGTASAFDFYKGMLIEGVLSLDNIVLLLVTLSLLEPKRDTQHRILTAGILASLFLRAGFVLAGFEAMASLSWISSGLGVLLALVGIKGIFANSEGPAEGDSMQRWQKVLKSLRPTRKPNSAGSIILLILALESVNSVLSLDSLSALLVSSDRPVVVFAASMFGTILLRATARSTNWIERNQARIAKATPWILLLTGLSLTLPALIPGWLTGTLSVGIFAAALIPGFRKTAPEGVSAG